jgi:hypothetical protein
MRVPAQVLTLMLPNEPTKRDLVTTLVSIGISPLFSKMAPTGIGAKVDSCPMQQNRE